MPEHIRSLVFILIISSIFFAFAKRYCVGFMELNEFVKRKNAWLITTLLAFTVGNFWIFAVLVTLYLISKFKNSANPVSVYLFLIFALPTGEVAIPGFGVINYLFMISFQKLLVLVILIPLLFSISAKNKQFKFGKTFTDKLVFLLIAYLSYLYIRDTSPTDMLRQTFYNVIEIYVPYYVISRFINNINLMREAILSLILGISTIACIAMFEYLKGWLLYAYLPFVLGVSDMTSYLGRAGFVRAIATTGHSIALGYAMAIGIILFLYYKEVSTKSSPQKSGLLVLIGGAFSGLSRGPWLGALLGWVCFTLTGKHAMKKLAQFLVVAVLGFGVLSALPGGEKYINLLPFIGKTEKENITYREHLFENSMIVIKRNFWTGSPNFMQTPEMEEMRNGVGVIDIVNSYLGMTLSSGVIGLILFIGIFASLILGLYKSIRNKALSEEERLISRSLLASLLATMLIIATTSSIGIIPILYWSLIGLSVAQINLTQRRNVSQGDVK